MRQAEIYRKNILAGRQDNGIRGKHRVESYG